MIRSPLNYMGGKYKLLPQILPLFPKKINTFFDVFAGGCNVGININSNKILLNDNLIYLIDLYKYLKENDEKSILFFIEDRILNLSLSKTNDAGYFELRKQYNHNRHPLDLFILSAYSFNHQIRFNQSHEFNTPFGKERSCFNEKMKSNLIQFISCLQNKNIILLNKSFDELSYSELDSNDFFYFDPPYLITTGTYNDGKRGFTGWAEKQEIKLLSIINNLNERKIKFGLSNVLEHKGKCNIILEEWIKKYNYNVHYLKVNYLNSSYKNKNSMNDFTKEVLITNY